MLKIEPITLLAGTHADTAQTGQGCFMNVIAYLNGEPQITDQSPCVCVTVRLIAIWLNDYLPADQRQSLIPFIERAMGSATEDRDEMNRRLALTVQFARDCSDLAQKYVANVAKYAKYAATNVAKYAAESEGLIELAFKYLDDVLPKPRATHTPEVLSRAEKLVQLATI